MTNRAYKVPFLATGNSARSIMASESFAGFPRGDVLALVVAQIIGTALGATIHKLLGRPLV